MDFFDFLSEFENYNTLVTTGKFTIKNIYANDPEDIDDIISEALEKLLDYFKRKPEKLLDIQEKEKDEMSNYLKKSMRNQVINILKKRNRLKNSNIELMVNLTKTEMQNLDWAKREYLNQDINRTLMEKGSANLNGCISDDHNFSVDKLKKDIHIFIEGKYRQERWNYKKSTIDIFFERFEKNLSMIKIKSLYPEKNIPSLNTEANRVIKKYLHWVEKR